MLNPVNQSLPVIDQLNQLDEYNTSPLYLIRSICLFLHLTDEGWVNSVWITAPHHRRHYIHPSLLPYAGLDV